MTYFVIGLCCGIALTAGAAVVTYYTLLIADIRGSFYRPRINP